MSDLVKLTIEGREVEVPAGTSVFEAAKLAGVLIPHYCYHPSLPVAGVCRMCLVDIEKGTMLGSGGVIVFDDSTDMVYQIMRLARFYAHESCAQCTQCREGTAWTTKILERILGGQGKMPDLDLLLDLADNMTGKTICVLSDSCAAPVVSGLKKFRGEFEDYITGKRQPVLAA